MNKENWPKLEANINWQSGFLVDFEIQRAIANNQLIRNGDVSQAKYASYELKIGSQVQQLVMDDNGDPNRDIYRVKSIPDDDSFIIQPGETFKIYAAERLFMPSNVLAISVPVGIMYKLGLNPETTFADPGFEGDFYITVCNYSPRIVRLKIGDPLARVFFFKLRERPEVIHESHPREMPPSVERVPRPTPDELAKAGEVALLQAVLGNVDPPHYQHAFVTNQLIGTQREAVDASFEKIGQQLRALRRVVVAIGAAALVLVVLAGYRVFMGYWPELTTGIIASLIATFVWGTICWIIQKINKWE